MANCVDPDETAGHTISSGSALFAKIPILSVGIKRSKGMDTLSIVIISRSFHIDKFPARAASGLCFQTHVFIIVKIKCENLATMKNKFAATHLY